MDCCHQLVDYHQPQTSTSTSSPLETSIASYVSPAAKRRAVSRLSTTETLPRSVRRTLKTRDRQSSMGVQPCWKSKFVHSCIRMKFLWRFQMRNMLAREIQTWPWSTKKHLQHHLIFQFNQYSHQGSYHFTRCVGYLCYYIFLFGIILVLRDL